VTDEIVLEGLFLHLVRSGFPLGIRDYRDALAALQGGFGIGTREKLLWLCHTLWARTNEEFRQLDLLFRSFPMPTEEEVKKLEPKQRRKKPLPPAPVDPLQTIHTTEQAKTPVQNQRSVPSGHILAGPKQEGIGLPRASVEPNYDEMFIMARRPIVSLRALTIIWRRFRAARREGPKVELDLDATINQQCRLGYLESPVLVPARRNKAKLIMLMDVSNSMLPWRDFQRMVVESLRTSHLGQAVVYFFHNVPTDVFYAHDTLTQPIPIEKAFQVHQSSTLMIFSDAGAVRGFHRRRRVEASAKFLTKVWKQWQPIVWMNPMPTDRWKNSSAAHISELSSASMLHLNEDGLVRAIDVLRGKPLKAN